VQKILVTDFGYPRACRFRKHQILIGRRSYLYQLFKKRDFYFINVAKIGKNGPKMDFSICLNFLPILAYFSHIYDFLKITFFLKLVVRRPI
jgi:hypothetical protein